MDNKYSLQALSSDQLAAYAHWFDDRESVNVLFKQSGVMELSSGKDSSSWAVLKGNEVIAVANIQITNQTGSLYVSVKPSMRRHGIGTQVTQLILDRPELKDLLRLKVKVELENVAGQKLLNKTGFVYTGQIEDDYMIFERGSI